MERAKLLVKEVTERPILTTFIVFIFLSFAILQLSFIYFHGQMDEYIKSVLSEAHGMIFDLSVIGILLFWLNKKGEKQIEIKRSHNDIDDIRYWRSEEASYKILGHVKRLIRNGVNKIELHNCYLRGINLSNCDLSHSNLNVADLCFGSLINTNLVHVRMNQTKIENANLNATNFSHALLNGSSMVNAKGVKTNFFRSTLIKADFRNAYLIEPNFSNSELSGADFSGASLYMPDFSGAQGLSPDQFAHVKVLTKPKMDEALLKQIEMQYPDIVKNSFLRKAG